MKKSRKKFVQHKNALYTPQKKTGSQLRAERAEQMLLERTEPPSKHIESIPTPVWRKNKGRKATLEQGRMCNAKKSPILIWWRREKQNGDKYQIPLIVEQHEEDKDYKCPNAATVTRQGNYGPEHRCVEHLSQRW